MSEQMTDMLVPYMQVLIDNGQMTFLIGLNEGVDF